MVASFTVPTSPVDIADAVVATLRDIVRFGTDHNAKRLPGIVARAAALAPVVPTIASVACRACAERHSESCGLRNPQPIARDAMLESVLAGLVEMIPDARIRAYAIDGETARVDAMYACTCHVDAPRHAPRATSTPRAASATSTGGDTVRLSIVDGVAFATYRDASATFVLPSDRNDHAAIAIVTSDLAAWVTAQPDTTPGQRNAATKKLRAHGYYTTPNGYADWLADHPTRHADAD